MKLRRLQPDGFGAASHMLARAFYDDPFQRYVFPDPEERRSRSPAHFMPLLRYGHLAGEVWTTERGIDGIGIWWPPEHAALRPDLLEEAGFNALAETIGADAFQRFISVLDFIEPFHAQAVPGPHWYAMVIGVDPPKQGTGVGAALMTSIADRADKADVPCYLETTQPKNVGFYGKFGYEVVEHGAVPGIELSYWTLRRLPLAPSAA
jgi:GNAT superfamily N-acetyltransferase